MANIKVPPLGFDTLYRQYVRPFFAQVPEMRRGKNTKISLADALSSCFAMFSLKCSSLLDFEQRTQREGENIRRAYRIDRIPGDSGMREILDKLDTGHLHGVFATLYKRFKRSGKLDGYRWSQGRLVVSIDGTGFFGSNKVHCPYCTVKKGGGRECYAHSLLSAVITCPGRKEVFPLASEPVSRQDGDTKKDCERNAARRLQGRLRELYPRERFLIVEDALYANAPPHRTAHGLGHGLPDRRKARREQGPFHPI